ncbi:flagellar basal-body MS-ring/collar protein FliF [Parendozoicomonas haliclonae]|uniref:Flagellar M-ring protein n=1 Tax=Parendozoicomonas haliclonae TaxID=1960125 RepID=A0A1X7ANF7_9GAMM|nr:flagellar basal-body MS-ring/collar protein FliF [Parendozoicomonas haliclonae]SMA49628.1 Flagellar M-ring protein [Parendozoicomonas haliclonae]
MSTLSASTVLPALNKQLDALRSTTSGKLIPMLKQHRMLALSGAAALIAVTLTFSFWSDNSDLKPLFGRQERYDVASVIETLDSSQIPYSLHPDSGQVLVDQTVLNNARMALAANGISPDMPVGMEVLSPQGELGRSQFVEQARYAQGLEGELAKTIISLRAVRNARVHLAIPQRSSFVRDVPAPTASVFVDLFPGARLKQPQIEAIVNLVSGSVPDLTPDKVTVLDQNGNMLSTTMIDGVPDWQLEHTQKREAALAQRITNLLEPVVGPGNLRVQVSANIDFSSEEVTSENFDNEAPVVRSESISNNDQSKPVAQGVPGIDSNRTAANNTDNGAVSSSSSTQRNYELGRTITQSRKAPGTLESLSIGIVVNSLAAATDTGWSAEALETMNRLVTDAAGLQPTRGDTLSLYSLPFSAEMDLTPESPWYALLDGEYGDYIIIGLGVTALLLLGLILRLHFYRKQIRREREQVRIKTLSHKESKDAAEAGLVIAVHPDDKIIERARQLAMNHPQQVALLIEKWVDGR